jgi:hypothetical protein
MLGTFRSFTALSTYVPQAYLSFSPDHWDINIRTKKNGTIHGGSAVILTYQLNIVIDKDVSPLEITIKGDLWLMALPRERGEV